MEMLINEELSFLQTHPVKHIALLSFVLIYHIQ